ARADDGLVEDLEPFGRALLAPVDRGRLHDGIGALHEREYLRVHEAIREVAVETGIEPVHALVDAGALAQVLGIRGRVDLVGEVLEDRGAFGQAKVAVLEHRHLVVGIDRRVLGLVLRAGEKIDDLVLQIDPRFGGEQHDGAAGGRCRMEVKLHAFPRGDYGLRAVTNHVLEGPHTPSLRTYGASTPARAARTSSWRFAPSSPARRMISPAGPRFIAKSIPSAIVLPMQIGASKRSNAMRS